MAETKDEKLAKWQRWIEQGERYKEEYGDSDAWGRYRNYYRGIFPKMNMMGENKANQTALAYNVTFSMARTTVPKVYLRDPHINVTQRKGFLGENPGRDMQAKVVECVANWLVQEMGLKSQMRSAALDGFLCNRMFWKVGYDSQFGYQPTTSVSEMMEEQTGQEDKQGRQIEHNVNVKPGMPWALRVDPDMMNVPFGVKTLAECNWIDHTILRPTEDVKRCTFYKGVSDLEGSHIDRLIHNSNKKALVDEIIKHTPMTELHEIRDVRHKMLRVLLTGQEEGRFIREVDDPLQIDGPPFVSAFFNEDPDWFWGPPDARIMEPQQLEINETNTQTMYHRRIALTKFFYDLNKISPATVNKILSGHVGPGIGVDGDVERAFKEVRIHIPQDLQGWLLAQESAIRTLLGMGRAQSGQVEGGRRTAEEARNVQMGFESRMDEKRDAMATALEEIMRKVMQIVFKFWKTPKVIQVVGFDGARYWVRYNNESIKGEYNFKVDAESLSPITKGQREKTLATLIQSLANNPKANIDYLITLLLREFSWLDAMKVLPEAPETAGGKPMDVNEFVGQQKRLAESPGELQGRAKQTANALQGIVR